MALEIIHMPKYSNILKIAVILANRNDKLAQLIEFNQRQPLSAIIDVLCEAWGLLDPDNYTLKFSESNNEYFITEANRNRIKNGCILRLQQKPAKIILDFIPKINSDIEAEQTVTLINLFKMASDLSFVREFIAENGLPLIFNNIEKEKFKGISLHYALVTLIEIMNHDLLSWNILKEQFVSKIISFVNDQTNAIDLKIIQSCLFILKNIILKTPDELFQAEKEINIQLLISYMENEDGIVQQNAIALINAILLKADKTKNDEIFSNLCTKKVNKIYEDFITNNVSKHILETELSYHLYVLQRLSLGLVEFNVHRRAESQEKESQEKIMELKKLALKSKKSNNILKLSKLLTRRFDKIYFDIDLTEDINQTNLGVLTLDCMLYFARNYRKKYKKLVLMNSEMQCEKEFTFVKKSVLLVKLLCDILHIGETISEQGQSHYPFLFTHDQPFEELFSICTIFLKKASKQIKATDDDFDRVLNFVEVKIVKALSASPKSFDSFRQEI